MSIDDLVARTKISRRMLEGLEQGAFSRLPGETFARLFLRQYLELIGEPVEPWMSRFAIAWKHAEEESTSGALPVMSTPVARGGRPWPWAVGVFVVVATVAGVVVLQQLRDQRHAGPPPTPTAVLALVTPAPLPTHTPGPVPSTVAPRCMLSLRAGERECWVEVRSGSGARQSRLLSPGEQWELLEVAGVVELTVGDAAALEVCFLGTRLPSLGAPGEVVRLRLDPAEYSRGEPGE